MVQVTLQPGEFAEVELPCDDTLSSLPVSASGDTVGIDVQATSDGLVWSSPVAGARLKNSDATLSLGLPSGTKKIRVLLHNGHGKDSSVTIDDA